MDAQFYLLFRWSTDSQDFITEFYNTQEEMILHDVNHMHVFSLISIHVTLISVNIFYTQRDLYTKLVQLWGEINGVSRTTTARVPFWIYIYLRRCWWYKATHGAIDPVTAVENQQLHSSGDDLCRYTHWTELYSSTLYKLTKPIICII